MMARLNQMSPRAKLATIIAIILLAPIAGFLGYRLGLLLGRR